MSALITAKVFQCEPQHSPLDITINPQSITCIVGPLRSGKTALLSALAGINRFHSGYLEILNQNPEHLSQAQWQALRKKVGYVLPNTALISHLTCLQNVILPLSYHRIAKPQEAEIQAKEMLRWLDSQAEYHALPSHMNEYEKRIINIARALMLKPDILFIDEAFSYLDVLKKKQFIQRYHTIKNELNISLVMATHDLQAAKECADQFIFVAENDILQFDSWQALQSSQHTCVVNYCKGFA